MPDTKVFTSNGVDEANLTTNGETQHSKWNYLKQRFTGQINTFSRDYLSIE